MPAIATQTDQRVNEQIESEQVRLVGADGAQIGIKSLDEALAIADEQGLDLVEVAGNAVPPVCRIMDFGKFKYLEAQRAKESRRNSSQTVIKEIKYRPKISRGDYDTKTRQVEKFLSEGNRVKVTIMFRGRELQHPELGRRILDEVAEAMGEHAKIDMTPRMDGRNMTMMLVPKKKPAQQQTPQQTSEQAEQQAPAQARQKTSEQAEQQTPRQAREQAQQQAPEQTQQQIDEQTRQPTPAASDQNNSTSK